MTETEWLTNDNAVVMMYAAGEAVGNHPDRVFYGQTPRRASDRKLRLFCAGCAWRMRRHGASITDASLDELHYPAAGSSAETWASAMAWNGMFLQAEKAALLREILGNPFRPTTLCAGREFACSFCDGTGRAWQVDVVRGDGSSTNRREAECDCCAGTGRQTHATEAPCRLCISLRTPDVLAIARVAYEERERRKCHRHETSGFRGHVHGNNSCPVTHARLGSGWGAPLKCSCKPTDCPDCTGMGVIDDGVLDPVRLAILADALEDAGCIHETLLLHLRGFEDVPAASGGITQATVRIPLRSPHYCGCWAVDLILGRE